jgi:sigma-B regulation protein RsbU (phosphoserine phosphatase)
VIRPYVEKLSQFTIYLCIYLFLQYILNLPGYLAVSFIIVLFLILQSLIQQSVRSFINLRFFPHLTTIENTLQEFNLRLNQIVDYDELLNEYQTIFEKIMIHGPWIFYINKDNMYIRCRTKSADIDTLLPMEIELTIAVDKRLLHPLEKLRSVSAISSTALSLFRSKNLDTVLSIPGKNRTVALLFSNSRNLNFLTKKSTSALAERVINKSGQILENTLLYRDIVQKNLQITKLFEVSQQILSSLNTEKILNFLLQELSEVVPFDAGVIFLFDPDSKILIRKVSKGYDQDIDLNLKVGQGACGWVAQHKQISLLADVRKSGEYYPARKETLSQIALPLLFQNELIGVLCLESNRLGYFTSRSLELLNIFAMQAASALNNAKQFEIFLAKQSLEHELLKAGKVQKVLLPSHPPSFNNLNISFAHIASKMVSGDLFDLVPMDPQTLGVIIGDVSGKGAHAAIMMSLLLAGFRAYKKSTLTVCEVVARLNNLLEESVSEGHYATLVYLTLSTAENKIIYTNAGHNPPIVLRADGSLERLMGGGIVVGYLPNEVYSQINITFRKGDILFCYTDGLTEAINVDGIEFGEDRLLQILKKNSQLNSYQLKNLILDEVNKFTGMKEFSDDLTIVIVKYI